MTTEAVLFEAKAKPSRDTAGALKKTPLPEPVAQQQSGLTLLARIRDGEVRALRDLLADIHEHMNDPPGEGRYIHFGALTTTHFCRFVLIPADPSLGCPGSLAFESNYDGDLDAHLDELIAAGGDALVSLYEKCVGFPGRQDLRGYLKGLSIENAAYYIGHRGLSQRWIRNDVEVRKVIEGYLAEEQKKKGWPPSPEALRAGIQAKLAVSTEVSTAGFDRELPSPYKLIPWAIALLPLLPFILVAGVPFLAGAIPVLRYKEMTDEPDPVERYFPLGNLASLEDRTVQNQLTHLVPIKPGWLRLLALKGVLFSVDRFAHYFANKGRLGGIPSIHFARWVIIDGGKRLLFFSNYDGSWENYLGDFIDKASFGLTGVWSNTVGFPRARFLVGDGATHEEQFKQWTRAHQIPTQVWYQAYPDVTVDNVLQNNDVRQKAGGALDTATLAAWLEKL